MLKVGQKWEMRNGRTATVLQPLSHTNFKFVCLTDRKELEHYTENGRYLKEGYDHALDLVKLL